MMLKDFTINFLVVEITIFIKTDINDMMLLRILILINPSNWKSRPLSWLGLTFYVMGSIILQKESFTHAATAHRCQDFVFQETPTIFFFDKKINSISTDHNNCPFHFEYRSNNKSAMRKLCNPLSLREIQSQSLFINLRTPFWSLNI